ncbi:uncharacterized protein C19orf47-like isoform X2 [Gigantopelta aegis]|nr:uncharacterized protein C19orf47-like isoform X2 [Gigantopelta aegis]
MLMDLSKEYLNDMGITRLGDVITILKHAKTVHTQEAREKTLKGTSVTALTSKSASTTRDASTSSMPARRSTPVSRIVDHYCKLVSDPDAVPMNSPSPKPLSKVLADITEVSKKSSVFDRLGNESTGGSKTVTVTGLDNLILNRSNSPQLSVFNRLGGKTTVKRAASSTSPDDDDSNGDSAQLEYAGIFKAVSTPKKAKISVTRTLKKPKTTAKMLAARKLVKKTIIIQKPEVSTTSHSLGTLASDNLNEQPSVKARLGKKVTAAVSSTTPTITVRLNPDVKKDLTPAHIESKLISMRNKIDIKSRLGPATSTEKGAESSSSKRSLTVSRHKTKESGVFSRLGKQPTS